MGCSPWDREESDTTKQLHFHFSLSCIGEGNGNPLQCSCLENPRDGGAWWAAIYGVAQSRTRLKQLSSSSSSSDNEQPHSGPVGGRVEKQLPSFDVTCSSFCHILVVQSLSCVHLFVTSWTAAHQGSLSFTISWSLFKRMSIELTVPSNYLILCRPLLLTSILFPASGSFLMSQLFASGGQSIGASASASVLSMNIQG